MRQTEFGNPLVDSDLDYGPLINAQGMEKVERLVETAIKERVKVETGGKRADTKNGIYYEPTVLSECLQGI